MITGYNSCFCSHIITPPYGCQAEVQNFKVCPAPGLNLTFELSFAIMAWREE